MVLWVGKMCCSPTKIVFWSTTGYLWLYDVTARMGQFLRLVSSKCCNVVKAVNVVMWCHIFNPHISSVNHIRDGQSFMLLGEIALRNCRFLFFDLYSVLSMINNVQNVLVT